MWIRIQSYRAEKKDFTQIKANTNGIEKWELHRWLHKHLYQTKSKKVTVVGGKTIVTEMLNEGFVMNEIEDIRIGYSWTISSESGYKSLNLRQHGTLKEWNLEDSWLN